LGAALAGALALTAGACTSPGDDPGLPVPVDLAAIYAQMCARCHGVDGRGDPVLKKQMPVRDFSSPDFQARAAANSDQIARVIMMGKNQMPAFGQSLSQPKTQALAGYVRRLGKAPAAATPPSAAAPLPAMPPAPAP
jgi:mono/diheme cytochrome c family protein